MKFNRSVWFLLFAGMALRCVAITHPLIDAHLLRQCQAAAATRSLISEGGFHLSYQIPWLGDLNAHYILEFPIYNYLVIGVNLLVAHLDVSGKLTSIALWGLSFICLQFIWRRFLDPEETLWANLLFVIAPLSVFYGQAFMPEMLVQLLAFAFVWQTCRYYEKPDLICWVGIVTLGLLGLLVKLPETAHLYVLLGFVIWRRDGWKSLFRPRYLIGGIVTLAVMQAWAGHVNSVNEVYLADWTPAKDLRKFIGPLTYRMHLKPWLATIGYVTGFILPGPAILAAIYGAVVYFRKSQFALFNAWLLSVAAFYLLWFGNGPTAQSYYNLPAVAPLCALFGFGMRKLLTHHWSLSRPRTAVMIATLLLVLPAIPVWEYLFREDNVIYQAALWAKQNTKASTNILFRLNHRPDMISYPYNAVPAYYSERPTFIWTTALSHQAAIRALDRSRDAIITLPPVPANDSPAFLDRFRGLRAPEPESPEWLEKSGFQYLGKSSGFEVFQKR